MTYKTLTKMEQNVLDALVDAWNDFLELPVEHPDDVTEFRHGIHALQVQILARPTRRQFNKDE